MKDKKIMLQNYISSVRRRNPTILNSILRPKISFLNLKKYSSPKLILGKLICPTKIIFAKKDKYAKS
jgi:hypothetical protein